MHLTYFAECSLEWYGPTNTQHSHPPLCIPGGGRGGREEEDPWRRRSEQGIEPWGRPYMNRVAELVDPVCTVVGVMRGRRTHISRLQVSGCAVFHPFRGQFECDGICTCVQAHVCDYTQSVWYSIALAALTPHNTLHLQGQMRASQETKTARVSVRTRGPGSSGGRVGKENQVGPGGAGRTRPRSSAKSKASPEVLCAWGLWSVVRQT